MQPIPSSPTRFIVVSAGRSGSTWLRRMLNTHPEMICHGELFGFDAVFGKFHLLAQMTLLEIDAERRADPVEFLHQRVWGGAGQAAVGVKLLYQHLESEYWPGLWADLQADKAVRVIHLRRRNLLKRLVSRKMMKKRQRKTLPEWINKRLPERWQLPVRPRPRQGLRVWVWPLECRRDFAAVRASHAAMAQSFAGHRVYEVVYEDLRAHRDQIMAEIQEFLGVRPAALKEEVKKINPDDLRKIVVNYDWLKKSMRNDPDAVFFD